MTQVPQPLFYSPRHRDGGRYLPGVMKSLLSPFRQQATGPSISPHQVHTPSSLLHFGKVGGGGFLHSGIEGKEGFSFQRKHKELLALKDLPSVHPPESPQPACFSHASTHTRLSQTSADTHSFPLEEVVEIQSGLWLRPVQSPWGQIRWCGWLEAMEGPKLPSQEERPV